MSARRAAVALLAASAFTGLAGGAEPASLVTWGEGPVRYLLGRSVTRQFAALRTEGARALFIERFWLARDPTAGTLRNEYREEFWARVEDANLRFSGPGPGWKTDRGRILILLGWPDWVETLDYPGLDSRPRLQSVDGGSSASGRQGDGVEVDAGLDRGHRGVERWHYANTESQALGPNLVVAFARDLSDQYRLAADASLYAARFPSGSGGAAFRSPIQLPATAGFAPAARVAIPADLPTISSLSGLVRFELVDAIEADSRRVATEVVTSSDFIDLFPLHSRWLFFLAPEDGRTIVLTGLEAPGPALYGPDPPASLVSYLLCYVSFAGAGGAEGPSLLADNEDSPRRVGFAAARGPVETWAATVVPPGAYRVALGLLDAATGRVASLRQDVVVPDLAGSGPRVSSLLLAERFDDGVAVRPPVRPERPYRPDDTFRLYYELYGLAAGYDVAYVFEGERAGEWRPLGGPVEVGQRSPGRQGWEFPLAEFPPGRYRLTVVARDLRERADRSSAVFEVIARAPAAAP